MAQEYNSADLEAGLTRAEVVEVQRKTGTSGCSGSWKIGLALLAIGLCAAAAVFVSIQNLKQDTNEGSGDLSVALRQISKRHHNGRQQAAIHLEGAVENDILVWRDDVDQAFSHGQLKLKDNMIIIPETGLYFVYSQVSFNIDCQANVEQTEVYHEVMRKSNQYEGERPLLKALRSTCKRLGSSDGEEWYGTINLGAVFSLKEGDQLSTYTSPVNVENVDGKSGKTFFGVFAL